MKRPRKATNQKVTRTLLEERVNWSKTLGFGKQRWVEFCEKMMAAGFSLYLYEARETRSKYITVAKDSKQFKVRFSDHRPSKFRLGDCDFFVGKGHGQITNTGQAIKAVEEFFKTTKDAS